MPYRVRSAGFDRGEDGPCREVDEHSTSESVEAGEVLMTEEESMDTVGADLGERKASEGRVGVVNERLEKAMCECHGSAVVIGLLISSAG